MLSIDRTASAFMPENSLLERAGMEVWNQARPLSKAAKVLFIAGPGNNGSDALVAARSAFVEGYLDILVLITAKGANAIQLKALQAMGVSITAEIDKARAFLQQSSAVIDGLCGTGMKGGLEGPFFQIVTMINKRPLGTFCISIDLPSGLCDDSEYQSLCVRADKTICMGLEKACLLDYHNRPEAGAIVTFNPGFPSQLTGEKDAILLQGQDFKDQDDPYAFKTKKGHVGFAGGSKDYPGALMLAASSAFHAGSGLVSIMCSEGQRDFYAPSWPQFIYRNEHDFSGLDCLCIGNGWLGGENLDPYIAADLPMVLDAGALRALGRRQVRFSKPTVLTPHPGELACLIDTAPLRTFRALTLAIQAYVDKSNCFLVLKACTTWIYGPTMKPACLDSPNSRLGVGGSGDVLSGLAASYLGRGCSGFEACTKAVLAHSLAGFDAMTLSRSLL